MLLFLKISLDLETCFLLKIPLSIFREEKDIVIKLFVEKKKNFKPLYVIHVCDCLF